jgi:hypothetical protein
MYWRWRERHQHPFNLVCHAIGIPLAVAGVVLLFVLPWDDWYWGVGAFVAGYVFQYIGHRVEGNDVGEWAAIKRLLGLPYVSIAPRYAPLLDRPAAGSSVNGVNGAGASQPARELAEVGHPGSHSAPR